MGLDGGHGCPNVVANNGVWPREGFDYPVVDVFVRKETPTHYNLLLIINIIRILVAGPYLESSHGSSTILAVEVLNDVYHQSLDMKDFIVEQFLDLKSVYSAMDTKVESDVFNTLEFLCFYFHDTFFCDPQPSEA